MHSSRSMSKESGSISNSTRRCWRQSTSAASTSAMPATRRRFSRKPQAPGFAMPRPSKSNGNTQAIIVPYDSPILTLADLKGKRIAFGRGSSAHNLLVAALERAGLARSDIAPAPLAPADGRSAGPPGDQDVLGLARDLPALHRGCLHGELRHRARNAPDRRTCGSARHPSRGGSIMTDRTATGWAQARALYEAIFGGRRSSDPCAFLRSRASDPAPSKRSTQMMSFMPTLMPALRMARLLTVLLVPALAACGQSQSQPQASPPPPPQVTIAKPVSKMVADQDEYVGRFVAVESVEVRARVPGYLEAIHFQDGQMVKEGDLLFTIDRRPFQIALAQTQASLAQARATLAFAESDLARAQGLTLGTVITQQTFDQRTQAKRIAEASVAAQQAAER